MAEYQTSRICEHCSSPFFARRPSSKTRFCTIRCSKFQFAGDIEQRLMTKVHKTDTCWLFTGNRNPNGYGMLTIDNKLMTAHRVSYAHFVGPINDGLCVLHRCDTPACVNPAHLFLGTHKDNATDRGAKNRNNFQRGEATGHAKLTSAQVLAIRASNEKTAILSHRYGVCMGSIRLIKARKTWTHI